MWKSVRELNGFEEMRGIWRKVIFYKEEMDVAIRVESFQFEKSARKLKRFGKKCARVQKKTSFYNLKTDIASRRRCGGDLIWTLRPLNLRWAPVVEIRDFLTNMSTTGGKNRADGHPEWPGCRPQVPNGVEKVPKMTAPSVNSASECSTHELETKLWKHVAETIPTPKFYFIPTRLANKKRCVLMPKPVICAFRILSLFCAELPI